MQEEWQDILGYEGKYQISNLGRVKNLERKVRTKGDSNYRTIKERIRKPQIKARGYHIATICDGMGNTKTFQVHQLVAQAFMPCFTKGMELNHKDGNPGNNSIINLEISNPSHNQLHAVRTGLKNPTGVSAYRYVYYIKNPKAKAKWAACIRHNGKSSFGWKTFNTEIEAAKYADELLDSINDSQRLRNFP